MNNKGFMEVLQEFVNGYGMGIDAAKLCTATYWKMHSLGYDVCILNDRYLMHEGKTYCFKKMKSQCKWIVKMA